MSKETNKVLNPKLIWTQLALYICSASLLIMFFVLSFTFTSCVTDDAEPELQIPTSQTIQVGNSFNLGFSANWDSSNDFVAEVSLEGVITANHVGECIISDGSKKCAVTVSPKSHFMTEPITEWGMKKSLLISKCGSDYKESGDAIGYATGIAKTPLIMYTFKDDKLSSSLIMVDVDYSESLMDFLLERYRPVNQEGYTFYFANGYSETSITTFVSASLYNKDFWSVLYIPFSNTRGGCELKEIQEELRVIKSKLQY